MSTGAIIMIIVAVVLTAFLAASIVRAGHRGRERARNRR